MYKKTWWLNPIGIYLILMCLVLLAYRTTELQYNNVYGMQKGIDGKCLILYILAFIFFLVGYLASGKYRLKGNSFATTMDDDRINIDSVYKAYKILTVICVLAYAVWYINFLRINGVSILSSFRSLSSISNMMYAMRNNSGRISGLTTFTEVGIVSVPLGLYLLYKIEDTNRKHNIIRNTIFIFILALFRTVAFSERLAIMELIVTSAVVVLAMTHSKKLRLFVMWGPIVAVILLIFIFGIFEYSRSWLHYYSNFYDSYFEFIVQRVMGYYTNAINTECLYIQHAETSILPYRTVEWLWELPGMSALYKNISPYNASLGFKSVLNTYGNPEYNNPGGLLAIYVDFGVLFPVFQIIFGFSVGRFYRLFRKGNLMGTIMYAFSFFALIEMPRYFSFSSTRAFFVYLGMFILFYMSKENCYVASGYTASKVESSD